MNSAANHDPTAGPQCGRSFSYAYQDANFADASTAERTVTASCHLAAQADTSIDITESPGASNVAAPADVLLLVARDGHATLRTTETGVDGNEILLLHNGTTLVAENAPQTVPNGLIEAQNGNVTLISADDVVTDYTSQILATTASGDAGTATATSPDPNLPLTQTGNIDIYGNSHAGFGDPYTGDGTVIVLRGEITPGTNGLTRVFGNGSADSITFDQTLLGGNTRAYGSALPTTPTQFAPSGDGEDTLTVYKLQSMATGQALTLDGQDGTDHYVIWTHGTQSATPYSYVVNVLDSGDPNLGVDNLDIYGADSSQNAAGDPDRRHLPPALRVLHPGRECGAAGRVLRPDRRSELDLHQPSGVRGAPAPDRGSGRRGRPARSPAVQLRRRRRTCQLRQRDQRPPQRVRPRRQRLLRRRRQRGADDARRRRRQRHLPGRPDLRDASRRDLQRPQPGHRLLPGRSPLRAATCRAARARPARRRAAAARATTPSPSTPTRRTLRLEGDDGNDIFLVQAFALGRDRRQQRQPRDGPAVHRHR